MLNKKIKVSNPQPEILAQEPYQLIEVLEHDQIVLFVRHHIKRFNPPVVFNWLANILIFGWVSGNLFIKTDLSVLNKLSYFSFGMLVFLLALLPLHELLHAAVYKLQGAKQIIIEAQWRKMVFLAIADKFVVDGRQFYLVALTPFVVITTFLLLFLPMANEPIQWVIYGSLLFHTAGCMGDFALCSFIWQNRHLKLYTYDDHLQKRSFFYGV